MTPEERSAATKARWAALSEEQKLERLNKMRAGKAAKLAPVPEGAEPVAAPVAIKKPKMTAEERSEAARARWVALPDAEKQERLNKMRAGRPVAAAPKEQKPKMTKEERAAATKARWAALSPEEKAEKVRKMVEGRAMSRAQV